MKNSGRKGIKLAWVCLFLSIAAANGKTAQEIESCLACHGDSSIAPNPRLDRLSHSVHKNLACLSCHQGASEIPHLPQTLVVRCGMCHEGTVASYMVSIHGQARSAGNLKAASCSDCHGAHDILPPGDPASRVFHGQIPATCGKCHVKEAAEFKRSIHGQALARGVREAPACTDCHGEHTIRSPRDSGVVNWKGSTTKTCSACHVSERLAIKFGLPVDRVQTFLDSYHGLAGKGGNLQVANCASCHGWHEVLPSLDPRSRIHSSHLAATCGQCHPNAALRLTSGKVHAMLAAKGEGSPIANFFRLVYLFLIPFFVSIMLIHNGADLFRKTLSRIPLPPLRVNAEEILLTVSERLQHGALIFSFFFLAYSGFALQFPDSWWAFPFRFLGAEQARRILHRTAAVVFMAVGLIHMGYLAFTPMGRRSLERLIPGWKDFWDFMRMGFFNFGFSKSRPPLERFSYIEKAEYWALIWGSAVMVFTGGVLVFHNFALAHFPLWFIEVCRVVHFMEAILACLAIGVWHFYWVFFDPEVYPMNWAWLTGRSRISGSDKKASLESESQKIED